MRHIHQSYGIAGESIRLHRTSGGRVYYLQCAGGRRVFKLYRPGHTEQACQSVEVLAYLEERGCPVVRVVPTLAGKRTLALESSGERCVGVLFDFAQGRNIGFLHRWRSGKQPAVHPKAGLLGRQLGQMHRLMEDYPGTLIPKGRARYIGDMIALMRRDGMDEAKTHDLEEYGDALWAAMAQTRPGFCHGDMHTGNTAYRGGRFTWMDFDRVSRSHPLMDVAWLADSSDFNAFDGGALERSMALLEALYAGYAAERTLTDAELTTVFCGIAIVHYDLIGSIVIRNGETLRGALVDEQHGWLMRWRELCARNNVGV